MKNINKQIHSKLEFKLDLKLYSHLDEELILS